LGRSHRQHSGDRHRDHDALTFSVADGIALGFITYVALKAGTGKYREISSACGCCARSLSPSSSFYKRSLETWLLFSGAARVVILIPGHFNARAGSL
jgi:xanthine/uracil/vitamin C permease (AzgA family)